MTDTVTYTDHNGTRREIEAYALIFLDDQEQRFNIRSASPHIPARDFVHMLRSLADRIENDPDYRADGGRLEIA